MKDNKKDLLKRFVGLTREEVINSKEKYGVNKLEEKKKQPLILKILSIFKEPMFLLLIIAASIYFIVGEYRDGIIMLIFVLAICLIEYIQETKTDKALEELNKLSALNVKVIILFLLLLLEIVPVNLINSPTWLLLSLIIE